jgi:hypothetical protein
VFGLVEPVTLGVIAAALVAKALDRAEDEAVDAGTGVLKRLVGLVRDRFSRDRDAPTTMAVSRVQDAPDSPSRVRELAVAIDGVAEADPAFRSELEGLVEEARHSGLVVGAIVQTAMGNQNVQSAGLVDSQVNVSYGSPGRDDVR